MRRELATSVAVVKDLVRGETCRVVFCILVFFRGCYHGCVARLAGSHVARIAMKRWAKGEKF